tara:strand:- start:13730 stop:14617 length:888 start_codon:yes stop_codon:yes gene_type:complete
MSEDTQGNSMPDNQQAAENSVFDSSDNFFDNLDQSVNGMVSEGEETQTPTEVTRSESDTEQVTHNESQSAPNNVDWEKRYKDSSRAAIGMAEELKGLKPFVPVLNAMKRDSGLVDHVRGYLENGGKPNKSIKESLGLDEDFVYDQQDAIENPDSDSAKVMNAHIDGLVQSRVNQVLTREKQAAGQMQQKFVQKKQEAEFMQKHGMTQEEFGKFKQQAQSRKLQLDDIHYILNKDKAAANVANNTKADMLNQMKNVRNIPTTASDSNNQGNNQKNPDDKLFDGMLGLDGDVDNLFG